MRFGTTVYPHILSLIKMEEGTSAEYKWYLMLPSRSGDPIADHYAVKLTKDCLLIVVADGCNWFGV
jgi:hypothetical protein